ncbi:chromate transporter [Leptotrichia trevisanii]|uniref:chromate transporter n=1 Tax=Leptotrichia trevisanii TaxID=109328 RepID=UPI0003F693EA|nr:chromate transporter [Leptotrichia trevisanii]
MEIELIKLMALSFEFFKTGLFAVGGGLATLPFLYDIGKRTGWYTAGDVSNMIAISQSTPGPMGINMATYVGFSISGLIGAVVAPTALIFPSVIIIIAISKTLTKFKEAALVQKIFYGLRPASTGLIVAAGLGIAKITLLNLPKYQITQDFADLLNYKSIILVAAIFGIMKKFDLHPIVLILIAAIVGVIFKF